MRRIKRFSSKRSELLFRTVAILLPLIGAVLLLSQTVFAQNTYVITDGERILIHTTAATDPKEVLDEAGLALGDEDTFTTEGGDGVSEITVQRYQNVLINHCGQDLTVEAHSETVGALLERLGIELDENTTVSFPMDTLTYNGMELAITRTIHTTETYTVSIPYETTYCEDPTLMLGTQTVISEGENGEMICTADITYRNGIQVNRNVVKQILSKQATPCIISVGTADPLASIDIAEMTATEDSDEDWYESVPEETFQEEEEPIVEDIPEVEDEPIVEDIPAEGDEPIVEDIPEQEDEPIVEETPSEPEIGNNTIITASGEVLTYTHTMVVEATAYTKTDAGCDDWTSTGTLARYGAIAVDPSVIPYGTRMYIVSNDGAYVYGIATAEDCGGAIGGARVDLYYDTKEECFAFGRRDCTIYFLA